MNVGCERQFALWRELMVVGNTFSDLWKRTRHLEPDELKAVAGLALVMASEMIDDQTISLIDRRRALLVAHLTAHRIIFDLMGLPALPSADLASDVCRLFFS